jgi:hypothetical protein
MKAIALATVLLAGMAVIILHRLTRPRPEAPGHWQEPEDGYAPGELPLADPRVTGLTTYLRGWQGPQVVYTRVGREWEQ